MSTLQVNKNNLQVLPESFWNNVTETVIKNKPKTSKLGPKGHAKAVHKFTKASLINAVYLLKNNTKLTVDETLSIVKEIFGVDISRRDVYKYRYLQRQKNLLTPHDTSASLTQQGVKNSISFFVTFNNNNTILKSN